MKTTETPWRVADHYIMAPDKSVLAIIPGDSIEEKANAALIVRAVNSHAQLVEALERFVNHQHALDAAGSKSAFAFADIATQARRALSLAKTLIP